MAERSLNGVLVAGAAALLVAGCAGDGASDGKSLVSQLCAGCHAVGPTGVSPLAAAPRFAELMERWSPEDLAEALAEGIAVGHNEVEMPEFAFEPAEIDAIIAYLETLRSARRN